MIKTEKNRKNKNLQLKLAMLKYSKLITAFLVVVIAASSYYFILEPKYQQVGIGGKYNLDTLKSEVANRKEYLANLKKLISDYKSISQEELKKVKQVLPTEKDIPGLFVQLQALAESHSLFLSGVSINEAAPAAKAKTERSSGGEIKKLNLSISVVGSENNGYEKLKEFLTALEDNLRLFDINAVYFSPDSPAYSLEVFTYYY